MRNYPLQSTYNCLLSKIPTRFYWIAFALLILVQFYSCKDYVEEKCEKACDFSIQCSQKALKKTFSQQEKDSAKIYCVQGCTMLQSEVLECFDETYPSCEGFQRCIIQSGILE